LKGEPAEHGAVRHRDDHLSFQARTGGVGEADVHGGDRYLLGDFHADIDFGDLDGARWSGKWPRLGHYEVSGPWVRVGISDLSTGWKGQCEYGQEAKQI
jgi:hypothetical protein